jgi:hypothetical protein
MSVSQLPVDAGRSRVPALALTKTEAAQALGVSFDFFAENIFGELPRRATWPAHPHSRLRARRVARAQRGPDA